MTRWLLLACTAGFLTAGLYGQQSQPAGSTVSTPPDYTTAITALKTIDPNILRYFPRWRICEPNLMIQIHQTFLLLGYPEEQLDMQHIVVTAAPTLRRAGEEFEILLIECGTAKMVSSEIEANMRSLASFLADPQRRYCYEDIPPSVPPTPAQAEAIINFQMPTHVGHAISVSAFEQNLKLGNSGFWLRASIGADAIGYHFWSAGIARVLLQRPLIQNRDERTQKAIPHLLDIQLGGGYRVTGGLDPNFLGGLIPTRKLNTVDGGYLVAGVDFYLPFSPQAGTRLAIEMPLRGVDPTRSINPTTYARLPIGPERDPLRAENPDWTIEPDTVVPLLHATGQWTLFYNWWLNPERPIHFFRLDVGISYAEIREAALLRQNDGRIALVRDGVEGLQTYKPREFGDWLYLRLEYRNQSTFPFGIALQYSNQILLGRAYVPIVGRWLYLEGKYATPLRPLRPFETRHFFMLSPLLRITI
jgi:hypothetical protein